MSNFGALWPRITGANAMNRSANRYFIGVCLQPFRRESPILQLTTDYGMDLAGSLRVLGEKRENIRSAGGKDTSVISTSNLNVFVRHLQFLHLVDPESCAGDRDQRIHVALNDDHRNVPGRREAVVTWEDAGRRSRRGFRADGSPDRCVFHAKIDGA